MTYPTYFEGLAITEEHDWPKTSKVKFLPKNFDSNDIDIKIELCGVCGSDLHNSAGRWGPRHFPMVPGHEIIGKIVNIGEGCSRDLKLGQRVGVGAIALTCQKDNCFGCSTGDLGYCEDFVLTYNTNYEDGYVSKGGFASHVRVNENVVYIIPDEIPSEFAGPLLCAGSAAFAQLYQNNIGKGSKVGIVGIGGIGSFGVIFGKYFGAEVITFDITENKRELVLDELKADAYFDSHKEMEKAVECFKSQFDLLIIATTHVSTIDWNSFIKLMKFGGKMISVAEPPFDEKIIFNGFSVLGCTFQSGLIASIKETEIMLAIVAENNLKFFVEKYPINAENLEAAFKRMDNGDTYFRIVMTDYDKYFE